MDEIIFVPVGDYYEKNGLITSKHRYNMLKLAIENIKEMEIETIAIESTIKLYAIDTFKLIKEKYKNDDIYFIMGSDNYRKMPTWKNYKDLITNNKIIVIERERSEIRNNSCENIINFIPKKIETISSTEIRKMIKNKEDEKVKKYVNENVYKYIQKNNLYLI